MSALIGASVGLATFMAQSREENSLPYLGGAVYVGAGAFVGAFAGYLVYTVSER